MICNINQFSEICQIRLDFVTTGLGQPTSTTGACTAGTTDTLTITPGAGSLAGADPPVLCGTLTGQHGKTFIHTKTFYPNLFDNSIKYCISYIICFL